VIVLLSFFLSLMVKPQLITQNPRDCVCVSLFYVPILGNQCTVPGFHQGEPRAHAPTTQNRRRETSTCFLQTTWGSQILTLHLNSVAGYTGPLLFLCERTQQLTPLTTRGMPWRLRVGAGPMFVRTHRWGVIRTRTRKPIWTTKDRVAWYGW